MQRTAVQQMTDLALDARRVARRVEGDLLAIHEKFDMETESKLRDLAHDVEVGLAHDCIASLKLFLYRKGSSEPHRVYRYDRVAAGSFGPSPHSGRIDRDPLLVGGTLEFEVALRDRLTWEELKRTGKLRITWAPCGGRSTTGMNEVPDGGYQSGSIGFSRTCLKQVGA